MITVQEVTVEETRAEAGWLVSLLFLKPSI